MNTDPHWEQFKIAVAEILRARLERMAQDAEQPLAVLNPPPMTPKTIAPMRTRRTTRKVGEVHKVKAATAVNEIPQGA